MTMKAPIYLLLCICILSACKKDKETPLVSEENLGFEKYFGGELDDQANALIVVDQAIFAYGTTYSFDDPNGDHFLVKTDLDGNSLFEKQFDLGGIEFGKALLHTSDGNLLLLGTTKNGVSGKKDMHLLKVNLSGDFIWERTYGGDQGELAAYIIETNVNEYCLVGATASSGVGSNDMYILWVDQQGEIIREKTFGGQYSDGAAKVIEFENGDLMVYGYTQSIDEVSRDMYMIKMSAVGDSIWAKRYGGSGYEESHDCVRTSDGGFAFVGHSASTDPNHNMYAVKIDAEGNVLWEQDFGGNLHDGGQAVLENANGNYVFVGRTVSYENGNRNILMVTTDADGGILGEKIIGGTLNDWGQDIVEIENQYFIAGQSNSQSLGYDDLLLMRIPVE